MSVPFCQGTYFSIFCCSYICKWWVGNYSKGTVFMPFLVKDWMPCGGGTFSWTKTAIGTVFSPTESTEKTL